MSKKAFMKALKAFIKPFETPERRMKIKMLVIKIKVMFLRDFARFFKKVIN